MWAGYRSFGGPTGRASGFSGAVSLLLTKTRRKRSTRNRPVGLALFPRPIIHAKDAYRLWRRARDRAQTTKKRGSRNEHRKLWCQPLTHLGAGGQTECDKSIAQPIGHAGIRLHQIRKPFGENLAWASGCATDKFAHGKTQDDTTTSTGQVSHRSDIGSMHPFGGLLADRTGSTGKPTGDMHHQFGRGPTNRRDDDAIRKR